MTAAVFCGFSPYCQSNKSRLQAHRLAKVRSGLFRCCKTYFRICCVRHPCGRPRVLSVFAICTTRNCTVTMHNQQKQMKNERFNTSNIYIGKPVTSLNFVSYYLCFGECLTHRNVQNIYTLVYNSDRVTPLVGIWRDEKTLGQK